MAAERATRQRIEARLDELVAENRFTIAVVFPLVGAAMLLASAAGLVGPPLRYNPYLILFGTAVMRLPLVAGLAPLFDRRAAVATGLLVAYSFGIELVGVLTGWPYGDFSYTIELGPMLFGAVPLGLPVFFLPLVFNSYLLCQLVLGELARRRAVRLVAVICTVLLVDVVLDPGTVAIGFWSYSGGAFYGVPVSNYVGWVLSATVTVFLLDYGFDRARLLNRLENCEFMLDDLVSFVVLWGSINAVFGNWIPVGVALVLAGGLVKTDRFDVAGLGSGDPGSTEG
ncbi:bisanhydrobacterioruberin hydratase [Halococcus thailandensis]|uniref:Carotene biosynthesis associated membrane protein n=1 Tax=Halococcus thailandensis JCM 13552 TaxID=1227457 RepID=M0N1Y4_9EURY|nr:bisanhydrobacterioruberin hydratase [Halococcus thailandensis]EMA51962.1 carotene biosynthesis associated membrane protein [Halococcus thailandensis JCM 13552]